MGYIFMIVAGAAAGWLAAIMQRAFSARGLLVNLGAGIFGALIAGLLVSPVLIGESLGTGSYTVDELLVSIGGSVAAVASASLLRSWRLL